MVASSVMHIHRGVFGFILILYTIQCSGSSAEDLDAGWGRDLTHGAQELTIGNPLPDEPPARLFVIDNLMGNAKAKELREWTIKNCKFSWARHAYPGMWCRNKRSKDLAKQYTTMVNSRLEHLGISIKFDNRDSFFGLVANKSEADFSNAPHIDFHSSLQYAAVHYLFYVERPSSSSGGTAFFRDKRTGIQRYTSSNQCQSYKEQSGGICGTRGDSDHDSRTAYMSFHDSSWEVLHVVPPKFDRLILYPSNQIHGAWMDKDAVNRFLLPAGMSPIENIRTGRLTSNLFGKRLGVSERVKKELEL